MQTFKKLFFLLNPHEKKHAGLLLLMIIIMALLDAIGVASIMPFMAVLTNPGLIETNLILNKMFQALSIFGVENNQQFLFFVGSLVLLLLLISLAFKALTSYAQIRFGQMRQYSISKRLMEGYLNEPYSWSLNKNSSEIGKNILDEVGVVVGLGIGEALQFIAKGCITISLIFLLILADPKLALLVGFTLCGLYGFIYYLLRNNLIRIGKERYKNNELRFKIISEAFNATRDIKVAGLEQIYTKRYSNCAHTYAKTSSHAEIIKQLPRFLLEALVFGGIMLIMLYLIGKTGSLNNALPILSLYVFAGYRLMPAVQVVYASSTQLSFAGPSINKLYDDIKSLKPFEENQDLSTLALNKSINLKNIHFNYPNASRTALKDINLSIPAKSKVGIVGTTGSGKSTTVDIILGLLEPQKGTLEVDGKIITKQNSRSWQRSIGYVPQSIFLSDDTVAANIAFGIESKDINQEAVEKASKIANLHEFVTDELPKKYQTTIGERGVRLSGGQRQRIGVARALYHNPQVLILDEATSALDNQTEQAVMDAINNLSKDITIVLIAHRLNTVKDCDTIFKLEKGNLVDQGTYDELISTN